MSDREPLPPSDPWAVSPHLGGSGGPGGPRLPPPEGRGPVLAWHNPLWWKDGCRPALTYGLPVVALCVAVDQGVGWVVTYWWLFVVGLTLLSVPYLRGRSLAAGREWFRHGRTWVSTYELISIRVVAYQGFNTLKLEDADGRRISIQMVTLQQNHSLWTLVRGGIVHSAQNGRLVLDRLTRTTLELPVLHAGPVKPSRWSAVRALLPLFSFGLLTPLVVGHAAWRLRCKRLVLGALAYGLPIPAFLVAAVVVPNSDTAVDWAAAGVVSGLIIAWTLGGLHAYRLRWRVFAAPQAEKAREHILARRAGPPDRG